MKDKLLLQAKNNYVTMHTARDETYLEKKKDKAAAYTSARSTLQPSS